MERNRIKRIYDLHAWTGVVTGLFIFIVSLSGVFALFGDEITTWENEKLRIKLADQPIEIMPIFSQYVSEIQQQGRVRSLSLRLPTQKEPFYRAFASIQLKGSKKRKQLNKSWHANTGEVIPDRGAGLARWIINFHRNLMLPSTLGRTLVGVAGILLLLLILSGIVTHRKILRETFTWRIYRSIRLKWQDSHKIIGVWGVPFHIMIAFTGAWLGLIAILVPITAAISFKGDQDALIAAVIGKQEKPAGISANMSSIDIAIKQVVQKTNIKPEIIIISFWGDKKAKYEFLFPPQRKLIRYGQVKVNAVSGEVNAPKLAAKPGIAYRVLLSMTSLHYALFDGLWLKYLYALLGIALCIVTATGSMMWLERRLHGNEGKYSDHFYHILGDITVGVCAGMGLATFAIFYADKLLDVSASQRLSAIGTTYFLIWGAALLYALLRRHEYKATRELLAATALLAIGIPVLNYATTSQGLIHLLESGHNYAAGTDITALITGLVLLCASLLIPGERKTLQKTPKKTPKETSSSQPAEARHSLIRFQPFRAWAIYIFKYIKPNM